MLTGGRADVLNAYQQWRTLQIEHTINHLFCKQSRIWQLFQFFDLYIILSIHFRSVGIEKCIQTHLLFWQINTWPMNESEHQQYPFLCNLHFLLTSVLSRCVWQWFHAEILLYVNHHQSISLQSMIEETLCISIDIELFFSVWIMISLDS